jgi:hypothetical protein
MRVAISGTHGVGKSTLIEVFAHRHGNYVVEPEAYEALETLHGDVFAAEPSAEDFYRQLEYHVERLRAYSAGDRVVFERSPADYVAYLVALEDLKRESADAGLTDRALATAREAMSRLDLIVYVPDNGGGPKGEDRELGRAVDLRLEEILLNGEFRLVLGDAPRVVEAVGSTAQRLRILEAALR